MMPDKSDSNASNKNIRSYHMKSSRYLLLRIKIVVMMLYNGKLSAKKILNLIICYVSYYLKAEKSARYPFAINFELSNECNANCLFCRTSKGEIYNQNPNDSTFIPKGHMSFELFKNVIDEAKDYLLMAILYVNGEPLIYKQLNEAIEYASQNKVATMISTNGILLNEPSIDMLLNSGIDFIKIAISGFFQETYSKQVRFGNIERIKQNLQLLGEKNIKNGNKTVVLVDFMHYDYNEHEIELARHFFTDMGFMFNVRKGNTANTDNTDNTEINILKESPSSIPLCDWPWKVLTINWNGDVFPCCDYVVWTNLAPYRRMTPDAVNIREIWNGETAIKNRKVHSTLGRKAIPVCSHCNRSSITFKY